MTSPLSIVRTPRVCFEISATVSDFAPPPDGVIAVRVLGGAGDPVAAAAEKAAHKITEICSRCDAWYRGRNLGLTVDGSAPRCAAEGPCGGLQSGMGYPRYEGPFSQEHFEASCVACGGGAEKVVATQDGFRRGYCNACFSIFAGRLGSR